MNYKIIFRLREKWIGFCQSFWRSFWWSNVQLPIRTKVRLQASITDIQDRKVLSTSSSTIRITNRFLLLKSINNSSAHITGFSLFLFLTISGPNISHCQCQNSNLIGWLIGFFLTTLGSTKKRSAYSAHTCPKKTFYSHYKCSN